jgi:hypothetical protein
MDFVDECREWLKRQRDYFCFQLNDEQLVNAIGSHYHFWLKAQPYPPPVCQSDMMAEASKGTQQDLEDAREDQATFGKKPSSPEEELEWKEEQERLAEVTAPPKPKPGPRPKDQV